MDNWGEQPIQPEVREQIVEPLIQATSVTLREMLNLEVFEQVSYQTRRPITLAELSAIIGMTSAKGGALVLGCAEPTAAALAGRILAGTVEQPEAELIADCLGELTNVIAGQFKAMLFGTPYHFTLTTPTTVAGTGQPIALAAGTTCLVVVFGSEVGEVVVQACVNL